MGRPPLEIKQQQLTFSLPPMIRSHLEKAAAAAGHSLAEEIRRRLSETVRWERVDPVIAELLAGLENIAALLRRDFGREWHASSRAHESFVTAVKQRLAAYEPPAPRPGGGASDLVEPPDTIGRLRERDDQGMHDYPQLKMAQKRKARRAALLARRIKAKKEGANE
jgi:hypothetical protein